MKKIILLGLSLTLLSLPMGASAVQETETKLDVGNLKMDSKLVEVTAKVVSIDQKTRMVTLEGSEGNLFTTKVDDDVENLDKVKKGDLVNIQYYESLAWSIIKKDQKVTPVKETTQITLTAQPGKKPLKLETDKIRLIATIQKIDKKKETVTLKGPDGKEVTIKVREPKNLELVKKGDQVEITYTNSVAVAVEKK